MPLRVESQDRQQLTFFSCKCAGAMEAAAPPPEAEDAAGLAESLAHLTDLTSPASWYPAARMMRRRVVAHVGPTNSGKTHAALQALKAAQSGVYCGPLRLLASEVWAASSSVLFRSANIHVHVVAVHGAGADPAWPTCRLRTSSMRNTFPAASSQVRHTEIWCRHAIILSSTPVQLTNPTPFPAQGCRVSRALPDILKGMHRQCPRMCWASMRACRRAHA